VIDRDDADAAGRVEELGLRPRVTETVMADAATRRALAAETLAAAVAS
jgi:hypothetical protein